MERINPNSEVALYRQLDQILRGKILEGIWKPGDQLPTEAELIAQYGVSRITVRGAIKQLVADGLLVRSQGKGTFVATAKTLFPANDTIGFSKTCLMQGKRPNTQLLKVEKVFPPSDASKHLGMASHVKVLMTERLRSADGIPVAIETNFYSPILDDIVNADLNGSLFSILNQKYRITVKHGARTIAVCSATSYEANLLQINRRMPLLLFKDKILDSDNTPLYFSKQVYCTETMELSIY